MITRKALLALCFMNFCGRVVAGDAATEQSEINLEQEIKKRDCRNYQGLLEAGASEGNTTLVDAVLKFGKDHKVLCRRNDALCLAIQHNNDRVSAEMVKVFVRNGVSIDDEDNFGSAGRPLEHALSSAKIVTAQALVAYGAEINKEMRKGYSTALSCAAESAQVASVEFCLQNGAYVGGIRDRYSHDLLTKNRDSVLYYVFLLERESSNTPESVQRYNRDHLRDYQKIGTLLKTVMIENTLQEECPFSGALR